jgi:hypothetical protein
MSCDRPGRAPNVSTSIREPNGSSSMPTTSGMRAPEGDNGAAWEWDKHPPYRMLFERRR